MKTNLIKYTFLLAVAGFFLACSTKKDKWVNREFQALNTKYNVMYHGNMALDKGIEDLKTQYKDNFWEILPIERMVVSKEDKMPGEQQKNVNFERAEDKAIKAIQKRSMNIGGKERNPQMDEAHLLLGKARYYDQRFIPALEAFNYVLYKYPESDKIYEVKIWREKANLRMDNDAIAIANLQKLLKEIKFKDQIFADANAALAQAFLNVEEKDSAIVRLRLANKFTKHKEEKARYQFILGQLFEEMNQPDSAYVAYQRVIDMKRNSPKMYVIQAIGKQTLQFDPKTGDTLELNDKYKKLFKDRENRPYLANLNHQLALYYDKNDDKERAKKYYNASLRQPTEDQYLKASNYRNLATIYFDNAKYVSAGKYYDSTLVYLDTRVREYKNIKKKRENLEDVIKFEGIAQQNDSILAIIAMSDDKRIQYFEDYITKIKAEDEKAEKLEKQRQERASRDNGNISNDLGSNSKESKNTETMSRQDEAAKKAGGTSAASSFYFYNPTTVAYGKNEFRKRWGNRTYKNNWRWITSGNSQVTEKDPDIENSSEDDKEELASAKIISPRYTTDFYISQIPVRQTQIDTLILDRNFAYYQLGVIYKEKFTEYQLAANKLEMLLQNKPEERLVLPSYYNLFKIYEITDPAKAILMKNKIISEYPNSRYAQILQSNGLETDLVISSPEKAYADLFQEYENGNLLFVYQEVEKTIDQYTGDEIVSKFELLKANIIGKLKGLSEYKKALNYVALTYPNATEGKEAENLLKTNIPKLEKLNFDLEKPKSWKIIYPVDNPETKQAQILIGKLTKFASERTMQKLSVSVDIYTMNSYFVVIHGIPTEETANDINTILKDYKDYKITETSNVISAENYKVIQVKKNYEEFLLPRKTTPVVPEPAAEDKKEPVKQENPPRKRPVREENKPSTNNVIIPLPPGNEDEKKENNEKKKR